MHMQGSPQLALFFTYVSIQREEQYFLSCRHKHVKEKNRNRLTCRNAQNIFISSAYTDTCSSSYKIVVASRRPLISRCIVCDVAHPLTQRNFAQVSLSLNAKSTEKALLSELTRTTWNNERDLHQVVCSLMVRQDPSSHYACINLKRNLQQLGQTYISFMS